MSFLRTKARTSISKFDNAALDVDSGFSPSLHTRNVNQKSCTQVSKISFTHWNQSRDKYTVRLSKDQASFIKAWFRPDDALPPPNINISKVDSKEYDELKPTMVATNNMDFIQDMAYDCSFVASLCAAAARVDRGHPQVS